MTALAAFALAAAITFAVTPVAIRVARRTGFLDQPVGYKAHGAPTPYLGGVAVFAGFAVAALTFGGAAGRFAALFGCAAGLLALGTLDDLIAVPPRWRVLAEVGAAVVLSESGLGWEVFSSDVANLLLTVLWVVGLVNAFNLMDNLDGATGTVALTSGVGIGVLALVHGDSTLAAFSFAISGSCAGFLPRNLSRPARIFLGDGGSMAFGLLVAGAAMIAVHGHAMGGAALLAGVLLVGLAILDTTLVVVSRRRAGVPLVTAGRDHLSHRLLARLGSPRAVAVALAGAQAALCAVAIAGEELGSAPLVVSAGVCVALGMVAIGVLESPAWRPERGSAAPRHSSAAPVDSSFETV
jgi:UDP-GlcNAc:undecaprenyl-phosphate GlcNAc-1-phosphate transferase